MDGDPHGIPRRAFLALSGLTLAAALDAAAGAEAMAGPFETEEFARLIPPDKKLRTEWVRSLFARGAPEVYTLERGELRYIGMPVGGICCGTVYLGGDGRLWLWDIFNENKTGILPRDVHYSGYGVDQLVRPSDGASYVAPHEEQSPFDQGFELRVNGAARPLDARGWKHIAFTGQYPLGTVTYADPACPVRVKLTAYSPFIPLDADDSGLPCTVLEYALTNNGRAEVVADIGGWLENTCCRKSALAGPGKRVNAVRSGPAATVLECRFDTATEPPLPARPDIVIDAFERADYGRWRVEGDAFGAGPVRRADIPAYQGDVGGEGERVVNSHASAPGVTVAEKDSHTGKLTSPPCTVERRYLSFYIGGGANVEQVGLRVLVDGRVVRRAAGRNENRMHREALDLSEFAGRPAVIEIYDEGRGGWGNVGVDQIVLTDVPARDRPLQAERDFDTMALAVLGPGAGRSDVAPGDAFAELAADTEARRAAEGGKLVGAVSRSVRLGPGQTETVVFVVAWHFPNSGLDVPGASSGAYYARRFADASAVADYVAREYPRLSRLTRLWHDTWYESTLPYWFLNRTFANTSILATTTAHRFASGRFWGWEGIGCCEGTCCHVWHYAQAMGRIFPEIERGQREHVDFGVAFDERSGVIGYRGEHTGPAVDGQCGRILGALREHQMSADDAFLRRIWPRVRLAIQYLMQHDTDGDGLLDGAQENTLDAAWYGKIAWISSLYGAALRAGEAMAGDVGDAAFAAECGRRAAQTRAAIENQLFNGEYFVQRPEPGREKSLGTYETCHIDQVHGQSWAWQVGLGRTLDRDKTVSALKALYRYNFALDVGPYRRRFTPGRPYAVAGEAGLIMATNPRGLPHPFGNDKDWQFGYFNECMSGFEHQAASHMIAEGMVLEGLAVTRAIHDRYHPLRRNPYNEIECSDHYARAMASYGSFISACGFEYHGPRGHIGFAPCLSPGNFRAAFTAAEGWGSFAQRRSGRTLHAELHVRYGRLRLNTLALAADARSVMARLDGSRVHATVATDSGRAVVTFPGGITVPEGGKLTVTLSART